MTSNTITLFLPSLAGGGAERVFVQLANEFCRLGLNVELVLASAHGPYLKELSAGVRVVDLKSPGVLMSLPKLWRHLRTERPRVVLSGLDSANIVAIIANKLAGNDARNVISIRSVPSVAYRNAGSLRARMLMWAAAIVYRCADRIVANSEGAAGDFAKFFRIELERVHVIYNPVPIAQIEELSRLPVTHPWLGQNQPPIVLGVGRLDLLKDFPTLIRAFSLAQGKRQCRLVILGEGPDRQRLEDLVRKLNLGGDVAMPGFVDNPYPWMRAARVFVSSSLSEGCPNALMQALACGTHVISTDSPGGAAEILERGKWGDLVQVGDSAALSDNLIAALDRVGSRAISSRVLDFEVSRIGEQYLRVMLPEWQPSTGGCIS